MKRILLLLFILLMPFTCMAMAEEAIVSGEYSYAVLSDGTAEIIAYTGSAQTLVIPAEIDGYAVSCIGQGAFKDNTSIVSLTIPGHIKRIGKEAFYGCTSIRELTLEEGVEEIMWVAFAKCALEELSLPGSLKTMGHFAFSENLSLKKATLPASLVDIEKNPFPYCDSLAEIIVADGNPILSVENSVLFLTHTGSDGTDVKKLICYPGALTATAYETPADVHTIGDRSVTNDYISIFDISEGAVRLEFIPFYSCDNLFRICIPESVQLIDDAFFKYCDNCAAEVITGSFAHNYCMQNDIRHNTL